MMKWSVLALFTFGLHCCLSVVKKITPDEYFAIQSSCEKWFIVYINSQCLNAQLIDDFAFRTSSLFNHLQGTANIGVINGITDAAYYKFLGYDELQFVQVVDNPCSDKEDVKIPGQRQKMSFLNKEQTVEHLKALVKIYEQENCQSIQRLDEVDLNEVMTSCRINIVVTVSNDGDRGCAHEVEMLANEWKDKVDFGYLKGPNFGVWVFEEDKLTPDLVMTNPETCATHDLVYKLNERLNQITSPSEAKCSYPKTSSTSEAAPIPIVNEGTLQKSRENWIVLQSSPLNPYHRNIYKELQILSKKLKGNYRFGFMPNSQFSLFMYGRDKTKPKLITSKYDDFQAERYYKSLYELANNRSQGPETVNDLTAGQNIQPFVQNLNKAAIGARNNHEGTEPGEHYGDLHIASDESYKLVPGGELREETALKPTMVYPHSTLYSNYEDSRDAPNMSQISRATEITTLYGTRPFQGDGFGQSVPGGKFDVGTNALSNPLMISPKSSHYSNVQIPLNSPKFYSYEAIVPRVPYGASSLISGDSSQSVLRGILQMGEKTMLNPSEINSQPTQYLNVPDLHYAPDSNQRTYEATDPRVPSGPVPLDGGDSSHSVPEEKLGMEAKNMLNAKMVYTQPLPYPDFQDSNMAAPENLNVNDETEPKVHYGRRGIDHFSVPEVTTRVELKPWPTTAILDNNEIEQKVWNGTVDNAVSRRPFPQGKSQEGVTSFPNPTTINPTQYSHFEDSNQAALVNQNIYEPNNLKLRYGARDRDDSSQQYPKGISPEEVTSMTNPKAIYPQPSTFPYSQDTAQAAPVNQKIYEPTGSKSRSGFRDHDNSRQPYPEGTLQEGAKSLSRLKTIYPPFPSYPVSQDSNQVAPANEQIYEGSEPKLPHRLAEGDSSRKPYPEGKLLEGSKSSPSLKMIYPPPSMYPYSQDTNPAAPVNQNIYVTTGPKLRYGLRDRDDTRQPYAEAKVQEEVQFMKIPQTNNPYSWDSNQIAPVNQNIYEPTDAQLRNGFRDRDDSRQPNPEGKLQQVAKSLQSPKTAYTPLSRYTYFQDSNQAAPVNKNISEPTDPNLSKDFRDSDDSRQPYPQEKLQEGARSSPSSKMIYPQPSKHPYSHGTNQAPPVNWNTYEATDPKLRNGFTGNDDSRKLSPGEGVKSSQSPTSPQPSQNLNFQDSDIAVPESQNIYVGTKPKEYYGRRNSDDYSILGESEGDEKIVLNTTPISLPFIQDSGHEPNGPDGSRGVEGNGGERNYTYGQPNIETKLQQRVDVLPSFSMIYPQPSQYFHDQDSYIAGANSQDIYKGTEPRVKYGSGGSQSQRDFSAPGEKSENGLKFVENNQLIYPQFIQSPYIQDSGTEPNEREGIRGIGNGISRLPYTEGKTQEGISSPIQTTIYPFQNPHFQNSNQAAPENPNIYEAADPTLRYDPSDREDTRQAYPVAKSSPSQQAIYPQLPRYPHSQDTNQAAPVNQNIHEATGPTSSYGLRDSDDSRQPYPVGKSLANPKVLYPQPPRYRYSQDTDQAARVNQDNYEEPEPNPHYGLRDSDDSGPLNPEGKLQEAANSPGPKMIYGPPSRYPYSQDPNQAALVNQNIDEPTDLQLRIGFRDLDNSRQHYSEGKSMTNPRVLNVRTRVEGDNIKPPFSGRKLQKGVGNLVSSSTIYHQPFHDPQLQEYRQIPPANQIIFEAIVPKLPYGFKSSGIESADSSQSVSLEKLQPGVKSLPNPLTAHLQPSPDNEIPPANQIIFEAIVPELPYGYKSSGIESADSSQSVSVEKIQPGVKSLPKPITTKASETEERYKSSGIESADSSQSVSVENLQPGVKSLPNPLTANLQPSPDKEILPANKIILEAIVPKLPYSYKSSRIENANSTQSVSVEKLQPGVKSLPNPLTANLQPSPDNEIPPANQIIFGTIVPKLPYGFKSSGIESADSSPSVSVEKLQPGVKSLPNPLNANLQPSPDNEIPPANQIIFGAIVPKLPYGYKSSRIESADSSQSVSVEKLQPGVKSLLNPITTNLQPSADNQIPPENQIIFEAIVPKLPYGSPSGGITRKPYPEGKTQEEVKTLPMSITIYSQPFKYPHFQDDNHAAPVEQSISEMTEPKAHYRSRDIGDSSKPFPEEKNYVGETNFPSTIPIYPPFIPYANIQDSYHSPSRDQDSRYEPSGHKGSRGLGNDVSGLPYPEGKFQEEVKTLPNPKTIYHQPRQDPQLLNGNQAAPMSQIIREAMELKAQAGVKWLPNPITTNPQSSLETNFQNSVIGAPVSQDIHEATEPKEHQGSRAIDDSRQSVPDVKLLAGAKSLPDPITTNLQASPDIQDSDIGAPLSQDIHEETEPKEHHGSRAINDSSQSVPDVKLQAGEKSLPKPITTKASETEERYKSSRIESADSSQSVSVEKLQPGVKSLPNLITTNLQPSRDTNFQDSDIGTPVSQDIHEATEPKVRHGSRAVNDTKQSVPDVKLQTGEPEERYKSSGIQNADSSQPFPVEKLEPFQVAKFQGSSHGPNGTHGSLEATERKCGCNNTSQLAPEENLEGRSTILPNVGFIFSQSSQNPLVLPVTLKRENNTSKVDILVSARLLKDPNSNINVSVSSGNVPGKVSATGKLNLLVNLDLKVSIPSEVVEQQLEVLRTTSAGPAENGTSGARGLGSQVTRRTKDPDHHGGPSESDAQSITTIVVQQGNETIVTDSLEINNSAKVEEVNKNENSADQFKNITEANGTMPRNLEAETTRSDVAMKTVSKKPEIAGTQYVLVTVSPKISTEYDTTTEIHDGGILGGIDKGTAQSKTANATIERGNDRETNGARSIDSIVIQPNNTTIATERQGIKNINKAEEVMKKYENSAEQLMNFTEADVITNLKLEKETEKSDAKNKNPKLMGTNLTKPESDGKQYIPVTVRPNISKENDASMENYNGRFIDGIDKGSAQAELASVTTGTGTYLHKDQTTRGVISMDNTVVQQDNTTNATDSRGINNITNAAEAKKYENSSSQFKNITEITSQKLGEETGQSDAATKSSKIMGIEPEIAGTKYGPVTVTPNFSVEYDSTMENSAVGIIDGIGKQSGQPGTTNDAAAFNNLGTTAEKSNKQNGMPSTNLHEDQPTSAVQSIDNKHQLGSAAVGLDALGTNNSINALRVNENTADQLKNATEPYETKTQKLYEETARSGGEMSNQTYKTPEINLENMGPSATKPEEAFENAGIVTETAKLSADNHIDITIETPRTKLQVESTGALSGTPDLPTDIPKVVGVSNEPETATSEFYKTTIVNNGTDSVILEDPTTSTMTYEESARSDYRTESTKLALATAKPNQVTETLAIDLHESSSGKGAGYIGDEEVQKTWNITDDVQAQQKSIRSGVSAVELISGKPEGSTNNTSNASKVSDGATLPIETLTNITTDRINGTSEMGSDMSGMESKLYEIATDIVKKVADATGKSPAKLNEVIAIPNKKLETTGTSDARDIGSESTPENGGVGNGEAGGRAEVSILDSSANSTTSYDKSSTVASQQLGITVGGIRPENIETGSLAIITTENLNKVNPISGIDFQATQNMTGARGIGGAEVQNSSVEMVAQGSVKSNASLTENMPEIARTPGATSGNSSDVNEVPGIVSNTLRSETDETLTASSVSDQSIESSSNVFSAPTSQNMSADIRSEKTETARYVPLAIYPATRRIPVQSGDAEAAMESDSEKTVEAVHGFTVIPVKTRILSPSPAVNSKIVKIMPLSRHRS